MGIVCLMKTGLMAQNERVTRIIDEDTFGTSRRKLFVRLVNMNAHEKGKLGSKSGLLLLRNLLKAKKVDVETVGVPMGERW